MRARASSAISAALRAPEGGTLEGSGSARTACTHFW